MDISPPEEGAALKETVTRLIEREVVPAIGGFEARREFPRPLIEVVAEIHSGYALAEDSLVATITAYVNMLRVGEGTPNVQRILIAEDAPGIKDTDRHPVRNCFARRERERLASEDRETREPC